MKYILPLIIFCFAVLKANIVEITDGVPYVEFTVDGKHFKIQRSQAEDSYLTNTFALTSRPSPPFFIESFEVTDGIETYGELEVLDFISNNRGLFVDARLENWFNTSSIPSSVNIPFKIFLNNSPKRTEVLKSLGGVKNSSGNWNFSTSKSILMYCNGAWCGQSPTAINALIKIGYPKSKMKYYRGGMQAWQLLGLTVVTQKDKK